jgi:hypothetical protein
MRPTLSLARTGQSPRPSIPSAATLRCSAFDTAGDEFRPPVELSCVERCHG